MPDLNSLPPSSATSRRPSTHQMPPPTFNVLPSNQNAVNAVVPPTLPSPRFGPLGGAPAADNYAGPGPLRHPRPLTASELHLELEKEQEAVVNRLTRELDLLRAAQNASVVSNASSTSASGSGAEIPMIPDGRQHLLSGSGFSIPSTSRRHNRSTSNASTRSVAATAGSTGIGGSSASVVGITAPAPIRPGATALSRQNSTQSHSQYSQSRQSLSSSPAHHGSYTHSHMTDAAHTGYFHVRSPPGPPTSMPIATPGGTSLVEMSPGIMQATSRYEETAFYKQELESVKRENDALKRRIRDLERTMRDRRASDASRPRSDSVSTTASASVTAGGGSGVNIAGPRDRVVSMMSSASGNIGVGVPEDEVKVGESAASAGLRQEGSASTSEGAQAGQGGQAP